MRRSINVTKFGRAAKPGGLRNARERARLDAELFDFVVVVLAVEDFPLLGALKDNLALVGDFEARGGVDFAFFDEEVFESLPRFLADGVAVLHESDGVDFSQRVGDGVGDLVELVAADSPRTALYLRASSFLTFLNISAYWAPDLRISSE